MTLFFTFGESSCQEYSCWRRPCASAGTTAPPHGNQHNIGYIHILAEDRLFSSSRRSSAKSASVSIKFVMLNSQAEDRLKGKLAETNLKRICPGYLGWTTRVNLVISGKPCVTDTFSVVSPAKSCGHPRRFRVSFCVWSLFYHSYVCELVRTVGQNIITGN